jgi:hypothetical protein
MHALKIKAHIDSNHRIEIQLPMDVPEGDAEVIILLPAPVPAGEGLRAFFEKLDRHPAKQRHSKNDIDAYLAKERASWD